MCYSLPITRLEVIDLTCGFTVADQWFYLVKPPSKTTKAKSFTVFVQIIDRNNVRPFQDFSGSSTLFLRSMVWPETRFLGYIRSTLEVHFFDFILGVIKGKKTFFYR